MAFSLCLAAPAFRKGDGASENFKRHICRNIVVHELDVDLIGNLHVGDCISNDSVPGE